MADDKGSLTLLIASYLEPEHVARIRDVDARLCVVYHPELLAPPRYAADHGGPLDRSPAEEARWRSLLRKADILFDFDRANKAELPQLAPKLRWVQATSAGIGQFVKDQRYHERMPKTVFTTFGLC